MAANATSFKKGDPRINRKGRPKSFDALRELSLQIAHEEAKPGGKPVIVNGRKVTVAELILRGWAMSSNPVLQKAFIEVAFGKVPDSIVSSGSIELHVVYDKPEGPPADGSR